MMVGAGGAGGAAAMSGADMWRVIRSHLWLIISILILSIGGGIGANYLLGKYYARYTAVGYIQVQPTVSKSVITNINGESMDSNLLAIEQKSQVALLLNDTLLTKVLQNESSDIRKTSWFRKFNGNIPLAKEDFTDNYAVVPIPDTRLLKVTYTYSSPEDTRVIVNEMGSQHIKDETERIYFQGQLQSQQLNALKSKYQAQYLEVDARLTSLRSKVSNQGGVVMNRVNIKESQLENLRREQSKLDIDLKSAKSMLEQVQKSLNEGRDPPIVENQVDQNPNLGQYKAIAESYQQQYEGLRDQLGDGHPRVQQAAKATERARQKATDFEAEIRVKARNYVLDQYASAGASLQSSLDQVLSQIAQVQEELGDVTNDMVKYFTAEASQKGIADLLKQVNDQLDILETQQQQRIAGKVQWAVQPEKPTTRSFPQLKWSMLIAVAVGLALGIGIAFLRELTDTTVRSDRDITKVGQMALLGMIGDETQDPQAAGARLPLVIFDAPHSMMAEQLRQVRTRLQHAASLDTTRSLLVTSPSPGDGKTTICCNLAAGLALNGRRILLVDGNFRRPEIHKVFGLGNDQGFSDVLNGAVTFDEVVQETQVPNLTVMTSGPKPINATEMFESQLLVDFIDRALEEFDHVIFDSGPMMVVSESAAMAPKVDGVVTVVRARTNSRGLLQRLRDDLRKTKAEHLGVVLNAVRAQAGGYYNLIKAKRDGRKRKK